MDPVQTVIDVLLFAAAAATVALAFGYYYPVQNADGRVSIGEFTEELRGRLFGKQPEPGEEPAETYWQIVKTGSFYSAVEVYANEDQRTGRAVGCDDIAEVRRTLRQMGLGRAPAWFEIDRSKGVIEVWR